MQDLFLRQYAVGANITASCRAAGVSRETIYQWKEHDTAFLIRFRKAEQEACDLIRAAIFDHAITGWDEPVVSMGKVVYVGGKLVDGVWVGGRPLMQHKYDSGLLARLAAAKLPEFKPKQEVEHTGAVDVTERVVFYMPQPEEAPADDDE